MSSHEKSVLQNILERKNPEDLFELTSLQLVSPRKFIIKFGTRRLYVDFPRFVDIILIDIHGTCEEKMKKADIKPLELINTPDEVKKRKNKIKTIVKEINREKEDIKTRLGKLTYILKKIGIKWSLKYALHYKKPVITIDVKEYYRKIWKEKLKDFINKLTHDDSLLSIYNKVHILTISYEKLQEKVTRIPKIFNLFFDENFEKLKRELEHIFKLVRKVEKQYHKNHPINHYDLSIHIYLNETVMDIKTLIQQILNVIESGYCLAAFILLRKILVDIGYLILYSSYPINNIENEESKFGKDYIKGLERYASKFIQKWKFTLSYKGYILIEEDRKPELKEAKKIRIRDIETFRNTLKKKPLKFKQ
ncbi:MAG: hypothetical protein NDF54_08015, partial [archaeon GB-1867-035]|nr:hypothetical protein [Candidatus Culexmicrobium profundum]